MEHIAFDRLTRRIGETASRRAGLRAALGALLAVGGGDALARHRGTSRRGRLRAEACIPTGKPCPSKKPRGHD